MTLRVNTGVPLLAWPPAKSPPRFGQESLFVDSLVQLLSTGWEAVDGDKRRRVLRGQEYLPVYWDVLPEALERLGVEPDQIKREKGCSGIILTCSAKTLSAL